jgi:hypothetical protein
MDGLKETHAKRSSCGCNCLLVLIPLTSRVAPCYHSLPLGIDMLSKQVARIPCPPYLPILLPNNLVSLEMYPIQDSLSLRDNI